MQKLHDNLSQNLSWYEKWHQRESHQQFHFIILAAVVILSGTFLLSSIDSYAKGFDDNESYPLSESVEKINSRALAELKVFETSSGKTKQDQIQSLRKMLTNRKVKILEKMASGDKNLASEFMPAEIRSRMPDTVRELVEEKLEATGNLAALFVDTIKEEDSYIDYTLEVYDENSEETTKYQLYFEKGYEPKLRNGSKVKVSGYTLDNKVFIAADGGNSSTQVLAEPALGDLVGTKTVLVIPVSFTDNTSQPISQTDLYNIYFVNSNSPNSLIKEGSYGKVSLSGAVTPWMQINATSGSGCNYTNWASLANQAAASAGYNISNYNYVQYYLNGVSTSICNWGGLGYVPGTQSWINGANAAHGSKAHELGHNFGAGHSGFYTCGSQQIGISSSCALNQYDERTAKMGGATETQFNGLHRSLFAWIPASQLVSVNGSGTYTLASDYSTSTTQPKILKIAKPDSNQNYYVTFKQALGLNSSISGGTTKGATVYVWNGATSQTQMLTMTPYSDNYNSALWDGGSFVDSVNGVTITQLSHTADTVTLDVKLTTPPCTPANPSIAVSPASRTASAGTGLSYTVSVTNRNSTYCSSSTFAINPSVPSGFSSSPVNVNIAPGATANSNITVTSTNTVVDGNYPYTVTATDNANPVSASASATYVVYTPPLDTEAPVVTIITPVNGAKVSGRVDVKVTAIDNIGVAKVEFYVDNKIVTTDTTVPYSYRWNINKKLSAGAHTLMVKAYDAAGNSASHSISVTK